MQLCEGIGLPIKPAYVQFNVDDNGVWSDELKEFFRYIYNNKQNYFKITNEKYYTCDELEFYYETWYESSSKRILEFTSYDKVNHVYKIDDACGSRLYVENGDYIIVQFILSDGLLQPIYETFVDEEIILRFFKKVQDV